MNKSLTIAKIGGNIVDDEAALAKFLGLFSELDGYKILVHGGGKIATELSLKLGLQPQIIDGRRITSSEEINIVTMVYAGLINKKITASLCSLNQQALGLSGADVSLIPSEKRPVKEIDYGYVGDIIQEQINVPFLDSLLHQHITPVIAPISADRNGTLLNVNADTIATCLAVAMSKNFNTTLALCFEKKGVLADANDDSSCVKILTESQYEDFKRNGIITKGMLPKTENAFFAAKQGVKVLIGHALDITNKSFGTEIKIGN